MIYDDGVTMRLSEDRFVVSCSSAHVAGVALRLEEWRQDRMESAARRHPRPHRRPGRRLAVSGPRALDPACAPPGWPIPIPTSAT